MKRINRTVTFEDGVEVGVVEEEYDVPVPQTISPRQLRLQLRSINMLDQIPTLLDSLPEGVREDAWIEWEYATEIRRDHPVLMQMIGALGLTEEQVNDFFIYASER